jgi:uncharacterized protein with GYD domain
MVRYLTLIQLTDQGLRELKDSAKRAARFVSEVEAARGKVLGQYWSVGQFDGAVIFEVADELTGAALLLKLSHEGYVRTQSQRLFDANEFQDVLNK